MELSRPELTSLAAQLRTLFIKRKRIQFPKFRLNERQRKTEFWEKSALACAEHGANPRDWIEAAFVYNTAKGGPFPHTLHGPAIKKWHKHYTLKDDYGGALGDVKSRVEFDFQILVACIEQNNTKPLNEQASLEQLLIDPLNKIAPYVAVVVLPESHAVRLKYLDKARQITSGSVAYLDAIYDLGYDTEILTNASITPFTDLRQQTTSR